ncbi:hypothetical protein GF336_02935 [Candidatus Woesearchaeota archaeon]|nr:hypothetical protein [Candidatus Woesearchaeota archaeon]
MRKMSEKKIIVDGLELNYEGIFDVKSLLDVIDKSCAEKGYVKQEKRRNEEIKEKGKDFYIELRPTKVKTAYFALLIKIRLHITNITEVEVIVDGKTRKLSKGNVHAVFDAWTITDIQNRWEQTPWYYFLRILVNQYIWRVGPDKFVDELIEDTHYIYNNLEGALELHRFIGTDEKKEKETEIKK